MCVRDHSCTVRTLREDLKKVDQTFEKRKKVVYDLICDNLYVPMKFKELAMLLQVPKEKRDELRRILEALEEEGKVYLTKRGK